MSLRAAISIITTMMGTEITPFITALQNKALIGSMGDKPIAKLSAIPLKRKPLPYGLLKGKLIPRANFDEPLADDEKEFFIPRGG